MLLAFLFQECDGDIAAHRAKIRKEVLDFGVRLEARRWAAGGGLSAWWLARELRPPRPEEVEGEPVHLC